MSVRQRAVLRLREHAESIELSALRLLDGHLDFIIHAIIAAEPNDTIRAGATYERPNPVPVATELVELAAALRQKALAYRSRLEQRQMERQILLPGDDYPF